MKRAIGEEVTVRFPNRNRYIGKITGYSGDRYIIKTSIHISSRDKRKHVDREIEAYEEQVV